MAEKTEFISALQEPEMLHGTIVRSPISRGRITSLDIPRFPEEVVVITSHDIPGSNAVRILHDTMPLLTHDVIQYTGQPILAVFAPTLEQAQVCASSIAMQFDTLPPDFEQQRIFTDSTVSHGDTDAVLSETEQVIERTYVTKEKQSSFTAPTGALTVPEEKRIIVHASTQWPFHVRTCIGEVCGVQKRKTVVRPTAYSPNYGEKLIYPSLYGCLTTLAAVKSGRPARLIDRYPALSPRVSIQRKTAFNAQGDPVAEDILVTADLGAFPLFAEEITEHLRAGVMGYIPMDSYRIRVRTAYSPNPPRYHFDGFCYYAGLFSSESQVSAACRSLSVNPAQWRINRYSSSKIRLLNGAAMKPAPVEELIQQVVKKSDFNRKHAACTMNQVQRGRGPSFTGYLRGIGIAAGYAPNGFSRNYPWEKQYSVMVRLEENSRLSIHTSLCNSGASYAWKQTCSEILGIPKENIEIAYGDTSNLPNSGPHILSRDIAVITPLIKRCCESIKSQRFKEPLPIVVKRGFKAKSHEPAKHFHTFLPFETACWASVVVEVEIDSISFMPEFRGIWCALDCGTLFDENLLRSNLRTKLLKDLQITVGERITQEYMPKIDIQFINRGSSVPLSGTQVLSGLFASAFTSAVSQALNTSITNLPLAPPDILSVLEDQ